MKTREWLDRILLSDHRWKQKYCPDLFHWLFEMNDEERKKVIEEFKRNKEE